MAYGDYSGPDKADKGQEGGSCNRARCQAPGAVWYNHGSRHWYCEGCRNDIEFDAFNLRDWRENYQPKTGHPMFETREMMDVRKHTVSVITTNIPALNMLLSEVRRMVPGQRVVIPFEVLTDIPAYVHNGATFTPGDRIIGNIIGGSYTHSMRVDEQSRDVIITRHEDTGKPHYTAPDRRNRHG